ncbi:putative non-muscle myosin II heavy chain [Neospora caninum Liverpool]|uniref:Non-muscle myosin II heavy chain, putative n=1 Tax=Neospora caninum (strain Liverpool) TaxID=572307 RepID=F0VM04_NEOCL|nr:putative non-muscle myosin II heavy chain [Neospora caninum Liverpool]CBZ54282.1 putative non-muscle myosin II heavy chain [Neospora caninum Liverpool]CEL68987.1 TPA: non-muscle myosin II heavy chain, putative [Neospora caninum Liverpool]|eukprot:XP_003884313.1 putative non-muscle myosin II heavy chain [Neospora caninum Liverpool]
MIREKATSVSNMFNHTVDIKRPEQKWTPLHLLPAAGKSDHPELMQHLARLKQEIADLRDYSERVTKELRALQLQQDSVLPRTADGRSIDIKKTPEVSHNEDGSAVRGVECFTELPLPAWTLDMKLMCPLISAYDTRLKDQQALLDRRETDVKTLAENVLTLTKENEALRNDVRSKASQLQTLFVGDGEANNDGKPGGKSIVALMHEKSELEELYNVTKEQNDVLLNQNHLMKCHVEQCEQAMELLRSQIAAAEQQEAAANEALRHNKTLEQLLNEAKIQLEELLEERDNLRACKDHHQQELSTLRATCSQLEDQTATLQQQLNEERQIAQEAEEASKSREAEKQIQFEALENQLTEMQENFVQLSQQNEDADRETQKAREIIDYLEGKTSTLEQENEQVKNSLSELNQKYQELVIEKEKLAVSANVVKSQLDKIREQHASELALQKSMMDDRFEGTTNQLQQQVEQLRQRSQDLATSNSDLTLRTEAAERRCKISDAAAAQAQQELRSASKSHHALVHQLQQTKMSLEKERDKLREEVDTLRATTTETVSAAMNEKQRVEKELVQVRFALASEEQVKRHTQSSLDALKQQVVELNGRNASIESELLGIRRKHDKEMDEVKRQYSEQLSLAEGKLRTLSQESHAKEQQAVQLMKEEAELRQKMKREYDSDRNTLESKISKLRAANSLLRSKMLELVQSLEQPPGKDSVLGSTSSFDLGTVRSSCTRESLP